MFFENKIISIKSTDKVLEIGPGANPYRRSDVLLEKKFEDEAEYAAQFGHSNKLTTDKKVVFYEGDKFPFEDNAFDYVICSHVIEHVENIPVFLSELFRVSKRGYMEYPLAYYEYLYNFNVHLNFVKYKNGTLNYLIKSKTDFNNYKPITDFYFATLQAGQVNLINDNLELMMEGFEWHEPFEWKEVTSFKDVCHDNYKIVSPQINVPEPEQESTKQLLKKLIKKIF